MATVEELKAAWDECAAKSKANGAARADIQKQIAELNATKARLEDEAREAWSDERDAQLAYDKARLPTVREARFLRESAQPGGRDYPRYTGTWRDQRTSAIAPFAGRLEELGWVSLAENGRYSQSTATITKEGQAKLAEYEANKAKPRKKASK